MNLFEGTQKSDFLCDHMKSNVCPECDFSGRELAIYNLDLIKNWFTNKWISENEYFRLTDLIF